MRKIGEIGVVLAVLPVVPVDLAVIELVADDIGDVMRSSPSGDVLAIRLCANGTGTG